MNTNNLAYIYNKNQSSWKDDPFQLGTKSGFKGVTSINHSINLSYYAQDLVSQHAKFDGENYDLYISDISTDEQNELARLYLEFTDRDTCECVYGDDLSINSDYTCALLAMLKNDCKETRDVFASVTRKNIITYYTRSLQEVLDQACYEHLRNVNDEEGLFAHHDSEHDEIRWGRV